MKKTICKTQKEVERFMSKWIEYPHKLVDNGYRKFYVFEKIIMDEIESFVSCIEIYQVSENEIVINHGMFSSLLDFNGVRRKLGIPTSFADYKENDFGYNSFQKIKKSDKVIVFPHVKNHYDQIENKKAMKEQDSNLIMLICSIAYVVILTGLFLVLR